jgi:serine protease inhibitor
MNSYHCQKNKVCTNLSCSPLNKVDHSKQQKKFMTHGFYNNPVKPIIKRDPFNLALLDQQDSTTLTDPPSLHQILTHSFDRDYFKSFPTAQEQEKTSDFYKDIQLSSRQFQTFMEKPDMPMIGDRGPMFDANTRECIKSNSNEFIFSRSVVPADNPVEPYDIPPVPVKQTQINKRFDVGLYSDPSLVPSYNDPPDSLVIPLTDQNIDSKPLMEPFENTQPSSTAILVNRFTTNMMNSYYHLLNKKDFVLCPWAVFMNLAVLYRGAEGNTEREIRDMLLLSNNTNKDIFYNNVVDTNKKFKKTPSLLHSNILIINDKIPIRKTFHKLLSPLLDLVLIDVKCLEKEITKINEYVEKVSNGTIQNIISQSSIPIDTKSILINTYYFYSTWKTGFPKEATRRELFLQIDSEQRMVEMMNLTNSIQWFVQGSNGQLLEMEYNDENYRFGLYLPKVTEAKPSGLPKDTINPANFVQMDELQQMINNLKKTRISYIKIPKFTKKNKFLVDEFYKSLLKNPNIFTIADLGYITPSKDLKINKIIHYVSLIINEEGSYESSYPINKQQQSISVFANRSFFYYIRHVPSNILLLMGFY